MSDGNVPTPPAGGLTSQEVTFVVQFHVLFSAIAVGLILLYGPNDYLILALVCGWHVAMMIACLRIQTLSSSTFRQIYWVSATASPWFVLPDVFLTKVLGVLEFPAQTDLYKIFDAVTCSMAGMWAIPFFLVLVVVHATTRTNRGGDGVYYRYSYRSYAIAAGTGWMIFVGAEFFVAEPLNLWVVPAHITFCYHNRMAVYVFVSELVLGMALLHHYATAARQPQTMDRFVCLLVGGAATALLYTGCLAIFYLLLEHGCIIK